MTKMKRGLGRRRGAVRRQLVDFGVGDECRLFMRNDDIIAMNIHLTDRLSSFLLPPRAARQLSSWRKRTRNSRGGNKSVSGPRPIQWAMDILTNQVGRCELWSELVLCKCRADSAKQQVGATERAALVEYASGENGARAARV